MAKLFITPAQCRMARALLNWTQPELANRCDLAPMTISKFEKEGSDYTPEARTLEKMATVFEAAGLEFTSGDGVKRQEKEIVTYRGQKGFESFIWDVYETTKKFGGQIFVSNVDETKFTQALGKEIDDLYMEKMQDLRKEQPFEFKILIKEGDTNFVASTYAQYRWIPKEQFFSTPFYVYADKLAFLLLDDEVTIHVIQNEEIANAQRAQFTLAWDNSIQEKE